MQSEMKDSSKSLTDGNSASTSAEEEPVLHDFAEEGPPISKWRLVALSISLSLGLFVSFLDGSITATALFTIGEEFHDLSRINWIAISYILADVGCAVTFTSVGDIIGRKNAYVIAFVLFFAFSLGCGFATSMTQLIVLRALQGVGGSGLYSLAMVIFPEISPREMKKWIGAIAGLVVGVSGVSGPILGGVITRYTSWRWIFWINGPICAVTIVLFLVAWPRDDQMMMQHERKTWANLDWAGSLLLIAASVLVVFAFQETGTRIHWSSPLFIGPLIAGLACFILLFIWQFLIWKYWRAKIVAVIPVQLFKNRRYMACTLSTMLMGFAFFAEIYNVPLRVQTVNGRSSLAAGVALLPMLGSVAVGSMLGGAVSGTKDRLSHTLTIGAALMSLGAGLLSKLEPTQHTSAKMYGFQVFSGLGFGLTVSSASILAAVECEISTHGVAQGLVAQVRVFGGAIGIAASTAILAVRENEKGIPAGTGSQPNSVAPQDRQVLRQAYSDAFQEIMWVSAGVSALAFVFALATFKRDLPDLQDRVLEQMRVEKERKERKEEAGVVGKGDTTPSTNSVAEETVPVVSKVDAGVDAGDEKGDNFNAARKSLTSIKPGEETLAEKEVVMPAGNAAVDKLVV